MSACLPPDALAVMSRSAESACLCRRVPRFARREAISAASSIPELVDGDVSSAREAIAGRYLGVDRGRRFAASRRSPRGTLLRLVLRNPRVWDLAAMLPDYV